MLDASNIAIGDSGKRLFTTELFKFFIERSFESVFRHRAEEVQIKVNIGFEIAESDSTFSELANDFEDVTIPNGSFEKRSESRIRK